MKDHHVNIFYSEADGGYIADIPDLACCSAFGQTPEEALDELREGGGGYKIDPAIASFPYDGTESFWTAGDMDWMVYASHESPVTFGGDWLVERMSAAVPEFGRYRYKGYDLALYESG